MVFSLFLNRFGREMREEDGNMCSNVGDLVDCREKKHTLGYSLPYAMPIASRFSWRT
jgi:hypothetical protein